ncbi:MAG: hypothetical protein RL662_52 [Bacteroidota bacterium]|jgi:hypothetical protein
MNKMINRTAFVAMALSFIGVCVIFSCSKVEVDNEAPQLQIVHPVADTVVMTDTFCPFVAYVSDNVGLSSYSIKIWNARMKSETDTFTLKSILEKESLIAALPDSAIYNKAFQSAQIFGKTRDTIDLASAFKIDSMLSVRGNNYPILLGKHYFKVTLVDMGGNIKVDSFLIDVTKYIKSRK